ncbi:MAG: phosphatidate cytidylyltransferase [Thermaerobacter sp.]|nr:phosphatidate cytidylyltransferase [Thermaerobacter sp.]
MKRSVLLMRTASMVIAMPLVLALVYLGGYYLLVGLVGFYLLGAHEWSRMCAEGGSIPVSWLNFFGGLPILWVAFTGHMWLMWPAMALLLAVNLIVPPLIGLSGGTVGMDLFGQVYIALPLAYLFLLRAHGFVPTAAALILVWATDIGAYLVGSQFGRHKLSPRLSPGKSWEGTGGGILLAIIAGATLLPSLLGRSVGFGILVGLVTGLLAVLGDLGESAIKRWANTKDSGNFMPGHGGLLDRIDSLLFALPLLYYLLR